MREGTFWAILFQPPQVVDSKRRDVRVVEGARLESVCRGNSTVGSNPTLSASLRSRALPPKRELRRGKPNEGCLATAAERKGGRSSIRHRSHRGTANRGDLRRVGRR